MSAALDAMPSMIDRIRHDLVRVKMPRALKALNQVACRRARRAVSTGSNRHPAVGTGAAREYPYALRMGGLGRPAQQFRYALARSQSGVLRRRFLQAWGFRSPLGDPVRQGKQVGTRSAGSRRRAGKPDH